MSNTSGKLPIKIVAQSTDQFNMLSDFVKSLPEEFIKQFESIEYGFSIKLNGKTDQVSKNKYRLIGNIRSVALSTQKQHFSMTFDVYSVISDITIAGKENGIVMDIFIPDSSRFEYTCTYDPKIYAEKKMLN